MSPRSDPSELPPGVILRIWKRSARLLPHKVNPCGTYSVRCVFPERHAHGDRSASAYLDPLRNIYGCVCLNEPLLAKELAKHFGQEFGAVVREVRPSFDATARGATSHSELQPAAAEASEQSTPAFTPDDAAELFSIALARRKASLDEDSDLRAYLQRRGILAALDPPNGGEPLLGVIPATCGANTSESVKVAVATLQRGDYRIIAPLFVASPCGAASAGRVAAVQARFAGDDVPNDWRRGRKSRTRGAARGTAFADPRGQAVISLDPGAEKRIVIGEGLTDFAALSLHSGLPILGVPGVGFLRAVLADDEESEDALHDWVSRLEDITLALDADEQGVEATATALDLLRARGKGRLRVRVVKWPDGTKDACEVLAVHGPEGLRRCVENAEVRIEPKPDGEHQPMSVTPSEPPARSKWPDPVSAVGYQGLAGDFVRILEPHTEADPVALLVQFLVAFGNLVGRGPHFGVEADWHYTNLFACLVGVSSKGRKGTSWGHVRRLTGHLDEAWQSEHIASGLSSGEGLIWAIRDAITQRKPTRDGKTVTGYEEIETDSGVTDKRLLVIESEFASPLRMMAREGNTLSPILRQAWDGGDLRALTKNSPAKASKAHVSIIGHVTRDELCRYLSSTEMGNGFADRFLWVCAKRSRVLPDGGSLDDRDLGPIHRHLESVIRFVRQLGPQPLTRESAARELWHSVYPDLSEGRPGLLGAVTSRAEAQVMRLALLYALLDCSESIHREHLEAGLALWRYCDASARFIFGDALGNPLADEILAGLRRNRDDGLTRTEISKLFGGHRRADEIAAALTLLREHGLADGRPEQTGGRPVERWLATRGGLQRAAAK